MTSSVPPPTAGSDAETPTGTPAPAASGSPVDPRDHLPGVTVLRGSQVRPALPPPQPLDPNLLPGVQRLDPRVPPSAEAAAAARHLLQSELDVDEAADAVAAALAGCPDVEAIVVVCTAVAPRAVHRWHGVGGRAWLRYWVHEQARVTPWVEGPPGGAVLMPWTSQMYRRGEEVAICDVTAVPDQIAKDAADLSVGAAQAAIAMPLLTRDGPLGSLSVTRSVPGQFHPQTFADVAILRDALTARFIAARDQQAMAAAVQQADRAQLRLDQVLSAAGHELRTPLSVVAAVGQSVRRQLIRSLDGSRGPVSPENLLDNFEDLLEASHQLGAGIDLLLGPLSEHDSAPQDDDGWGTSLATLIGVALHWHHSAAVATGAHLHVTSQVPEVEVAMPAHAARLTVAALFGNAISAVKEINAATGAPGAPGSAALIEVDVACRGSDDGHPRGRLVVRDAHTWPGSREDLQGTLEPFARFAGDHPGQGLGLAVAKSLVEQYGGACGVLLDASGRRACWAELPLLP